MTSNTDQPELPLVMAPQPLDGFVLVARVALDRPEVEYRLSWTSPGRGELSARVWLDAIWPIDKMSGRILALISNAHNDGPWTWATVMGCLNALQSAYGCEEPF